jgi:hypothetical protein
MKQKQFTLKLIAFCAGFMPAIGLFDQQTAAKFPEHAVQMIVPFGSGGMVDIVARLLQDVLGKAATCTAIYKASVQAAFTALAHHTGAQFCSFAVAAHEKFRQVVKQHNLMKQQTLLTL